MAKYKDFYPTPERLVEKMVEGIDFSCILSVLEPSAGKGDIADALAKKLKAERWRRYDHDDQTACRELIDCCEIDPELRMVLKGKHYRVVQDDFLALHTYKQYDLIAMNPPFSEGDKHLMKALQMQKRSGGLVVCLLNAETIKNPYSQLRRTLLEELDEAGAEIEYLQQAFADADRKTGVEVALIKVRYPKPERKGRIFSEYLERKEAVPVGENTECNGLIVSDFIKGIVQQYNAEVQCGLELIKEYKDMSGVILRSFQDDYNGPILELRLGRGGGKNVADENSFLREVRRKYWEALFQSKEFTSMLTSDLCYSYADRIDELFDYDFSFFNIYTLRLEISQLIVRSVEDTILKLFEDFTYHFSTEKAGNVQYFTGWKTNCAYMVKKRVIINLNAWSWDNFSPNYYKSGQRIQDIEKAMNYLDGGKTDFAPVYEVLEEAKKIGQTSKIESKYFYLTYYKKGTCHLEFKDDELLKKFNIFGCQRKGWLPPSYGKAAYKEMDAEAKAVVDSFDGGEEEYSRIVQKPDTYLYKPNVLIQLPA